MAGWTLLMPLLLQGISAAPADADAGVRPVQVATTAPLKSQPEKMICRRFQTTGTLASYQRVCRTKADWQRITNEHQKNWRDLQGHKGVVWAVPDVGP